jgi:hypothetical protein
LKQAITNIDYCTKDYNGFKEMLVDKLKKIMPQYTDTSETDAGIVLLELFSYGLDILSYYQDTLANEVFLPTEEQRENVLTWCDMFGYYPNSSTPSRFKQVFVLDEPLDSDLIIPEGTVVKTSAEDVEDEIYFETTADLTIPAGCSGVETDDDTGEYLYYAIVVQGESIKDELLGGSSGLANQEFVLGYHPVILDSVEVYVDIGDGFEKWTRVNNFMDSDTTSHHYKVYMNESGEATIVFGDGSFGLIPVKGDSNIYADYRLGGGTDGNVSANKIVELENDIEGVESTFNPDLPLVYGTDYETLDEIKRNAPIFARTLWGAITVEDFADLTKLLFTNVVCANAEQDSANQDKVHIYILLEDNETPTSDFLASIKNAFDMNNGGRSVVGTEVDVAQAKVTPVGFTMSVVMRDRYSQAEAKTKITELMQLYFDYGNYDFNTPLYLSELEGYLLDSENTLVSSVRSLRITVPTSEVTTPASNEIYSLGTITFNMTGGVA